MAERPNILFIFTDQQSATMMSCAGNAHFRTPAMDSIAADGVRFDRAYCTIPVCVPSRFSLMTGRMPSELGLRSNETAHLAGVPASVTDGGVGRLLAQAGYVVAYGGKEHLPKSVAEDYGFNVLTRDERDGLADACVDFLQQEHTQPFFLTASFINPHDICYFALCDFNDAEWVERVSQSKEVLTLREAEELPPGMSEEEFFATVCPPLPPNFEPQQDEPEAVRKFLEKRAFRIRAREHYGEREWRLHRWAYGRLTERVDAQIGRVIAALRASPYARNTLVVFTSDHGDHDASHRMEHKTVFYEEAARIPLIIAGPGVVPGRVEKTLASNGLDLLPTFCDYAGVAPPVDLQGHSLRPLVEGKVASLSRDYIPVENEIGRMVVTDGYKYMLHDDGAHREQLMDLAHDPHETRSALNDPHCQEALARCRKYYRRQFGEA